MNNDYLAFIFHVNREDLLLKAIDSVPELHSQLTVVDNSWEGIEYDLTDIYPKIRVEKPPVPLSASQSINMALVEGKRAGCKFVLIMHEDAEAVDGSGGKLVEFTRGLEQEGRRWGVVFTAYDCLASLSVTATDEVGMWDQNLPQYYVDNDMYRRLALAGYEKVESQLPVHHEPSQTLKSDPERQVINRVTFPLYGAYYAAKWGGSPGYETFLTAFNR